MLSGRHALLFGAAVLLAGGLLCCSSFSSDNNLIVDGGNPEAGDAEGSETAANDADGTNADGAVGSLVRTGVRCGSLERECAVGEKCCSDGASVAACAKKCSDVDAGLFQFECGRTSDCGGGLVCCMSSNAVCMGGALLFSECVPPSNCTFCGSDGGQQLRGCDRKLADACGEGQTCTGPLANQPYSACSF
jgi:hypothetical protein